MGKKVGAAAIAVLMVLGFVAFVATSAVKGKLISKGFYEKELRDNRVYDRLFDDVVDDPQFAPQLDALFGGINVAKEDVKDQIKNVAKPEYIQDLVESAIQAFITYFNGGKLQIDLDISKIVAGIHDTMIAYTIKEIEDKPVCESESLEAFAGQLQTLIGNMVAEGAIPECVPRFSIPEEHRAEVADALGQAGHLDINNPEHAQAIQMLVQAIQNDDIALAIKVSVAAMMTQLITQSVLQLTDNPYVHRVGEGEHLRFVMSPPQSLQDKLATKLGIVQTAGSAAGWAQIGGLVVVFLGGAALFLLFRDDKRTALRWIGAPILIGGAIGLVAWLIARGMVEDKVSGVIVKTKLPVSLQHIMTDVSGGIVEGVTPAFMIPSVAALALGAILIGASFALKKR